MMLAERITATLGRGMTKRAGVGFWSGSFPFLCLKKKNLAGGYSDVLFTL